MRDKFKGKDFLGFKDFTAEEIEYLVDLSAYFKKKWTAREPHDFLKGKSYAMIFEKNSTRTRNAFQKAAFDLGIQSVYLRPDEMQVSRGEPLKDTARILDRYFDGLFIRTFGQEIVEEFASWMKNPVINALTALEHPTQGIADFLTIKEKKGTLKGLKIAFTGDIYNVCHTTMIGAASFGMDMYIAGPEYLKPDEDRYQEALKRAKETGAKIVFTTDLDEALKDADIVYAVTQYSMGQSEEQIAKQIKDLRPYQIDMNAMKKAKKDAIFMHCLPAHRDQEVTDEVLECSQSVIFDEGENRMHSIKAILAAVTL